MCVFAGGGGGREGGDMSTQIRRSDGWIIYIYIYIYI